VIDDAKRFRSPHHVESYVGLVPNEDSSGGKRRLGAHQQKRQSVPALAFGRRRWSSSVIAITTSLLRVWAEAVAERRGRKIAVTAHRPTPRRACFRAMWRDSKAYDPNLSRGCQ